MTLPADAGAFARDWAEAWNSHDLDRILAHYAADAVLISPIAAALLGRADGRVEGKGALRAYFGKGLAAYPDLRFTPRAVTRGVAGLAVVYGNQAGQIVAEVMEFDADGLVARVVVHYGEAIPSATAAA